MAAHDAETLALFQEGETRLVFARLPDGELGFMEDGHAEDFAELSKAGYLRCVVPDCATPRLKKMNRGSKRHGFSHFAGAGGHAPMGVAHLQSQLLLARWLRQVGPDGCRVELEETTDDGKRRADVMFTHPRGRRIAFEVQYAGISVRDWRARHDYYVERGIVDVWLWGHLRPHLAEAKKRPGFVVIDEVQRAAVAAGLPVLWINPERGQLGTATDERIGPISGRSFEIPARGAAFARFHAMPLDECDIDPAHGVTHPLLRALWHHVEVLADEDEADRQRRAAEEEARREREAAVRRAELEELVRLRRELAEQEAEDARRRAGFDKFFARVGEKAAKRLSAWNQSAERKQIIAEFRKVPSWLSMDTGIRLPVADEEWQSTLFLRFIRGREPGTQVTKASLIQALTSMDPDVRKPEEAVGRWLRGLVDAHVLDRRPMKAPNGSDYRGWVIHVEKAQRPAPAPQPEPVPEPVPPVEHTPDLPRPTVAELRARGHQIPEPPPALRDRIVCVNCYGNLMIEEDQRVGYHLRCSWGIANSYGAEELRAFR
jgi:hypothetical protein